MILEKTYQQLKEMDDNLKNKVKQQGKYTEEMKKYLYILQDNLKDLIEKWKHKELSDSAKYIYQDRYYIKYKDGKKDESPEDIWRRVARSIISADTYYTDDIELLRLEENIIYDLLKAKIFLPNSPVMFNVGKNIEKSYFEKEKPTYEDYVYIRKNQLSKNTSAACYVLSISDDLENIMDTFKEVALISGAGGGIGLNFSTLRPEYAEIKSGGYSSGALSFLRTFNELGENILEGGIRRFAGMAVFGFADFNKDKWWDKVVTLHPDIIDFIKMKHDNNGENILNNFNISIGINNTKDLINRIENDKNISLTFNDTLYKDLVSKDFMDTIYNKLDKDKKKDVDIKLDGKINAKKIFNMIAENAWKTGDPGFVFLDKANKYNPLQEYIDIRATNPCVVGDTMVAVADGRGFVKIRDLAKEGKDVPVYSVNPKNGKIEIKMMRRPRKTGNNHKIYKVILDDGNSIRVNEHHEFILSDLSTKKVTELKKGDSLFVKPKYLVKKSSLSSYWRTNPLDPYSSEHRLIYESFNKKIGKNKIIHHKDFNSLNNNIDNLIELTHAQHIKIHMSGNNNPMNRWYKNASDELKQQYHNNMSYSVSGLKNGRAYNITNNEIKQIMINYVKKTNIPLSVTEWRKYIKKNHLPKSEYRNITNMVHEVNNIVFKIPLDIQKDRYSMRKIRTQFKKASKLTNYPLIWINDHIEVIKKCEYCGNEFTVPIENREISFCSMDCYNKYKEQQNIKDIKLLPIYNHKVVDIIEDGYEDVYNGTVDDNHNFGIGIGIDTNFDVNELNKNMKKGEVYKYNVTFTLNCGERPNLSSLKYNMITPCNLMSIDVSKFVNNGNYNFKLLENVSEIVLHLLDLVIDLQMFPLDNIKKGVLLLRDAGLGLMGLHGALILINKEYDDDSGRAYAYNIMKTIEIGSTNMSYNLSKWKYPYLATSVVDNNIPTAEIWNKPYSKYEIDEDDISYVNNIYDNLKSIFKKEGYNNLRNISRTSVAPTGSLSQLIQTEEYGDVGSGVEPIFALKYRRFVVNKDSKSKTNIEYTNKLLDKVIKDENILLQVKQYLMKNNTLQGISKEIKGTEDIENIFKTSLEIDYIDHIKMLESVQYCNSSSVSKTINLTKDKTIEDVKNAFMIAMKSPYIKGITIYRDGSLQTQVLNTTKKEPKLDFSLKNIQLNNKGKIIPKERPLVMEVLKKQIKIQNGKTLKFYIELGIDTNNEPFELFIRPTNSTKDYTVLFNTLGRLISLAFRSNVSLSEVIKQVKKVKNWNNEYDFICNIIADNVNELTSIAKKRGKRRVEEMKEINIQQKKWKMTSHGYYLDEEGKGHCPICGSEVILQEGCVTCPSCGWSACS